MANLVICCFLLAAPTSVLADIVRMYKISGDVCSEAAIDHQDRKAAFHSLGLTEGTCSDQGFTVEDGTKETLSMPFLGSVTFKKVRKSTFEASMLKAYAFISALWQPSHKTASNQHLQMQPMKSSAFDGDPSESAAFEECKIFEDFAAFEECIASSRSAAAAALAELQPLKSGAFDGDPENNLSNNLMMGEYWSKRLSSAESGWLERRIWMGSLGALALYGNRFDIKANLVLKPGNCCPVVLNSEDRSHCYAISQQCCTAVGADGPRVTGRASDVVDCLINQGDIDLARALSYKIVRGKMQEMFWTWDGPADVVV